ncbi:MAG: hypothetical protein ACK5OX_14245 [Desertimonas sp.]
MATSSTTPITRDDLERNFRSLQQGVQGRVDDKKPSLLAIGGGIGLVLALLIFFLGKRSGKKKTTLVEIRRF